jgi:hypothetical protein
MFVGISLSKSLASPNATVNRAQILGSGILPRSNRCWWVVPQLLCVWNWRGSLFCARLMHLRTISILLAQERWVKAAHHRQVHGGFELTWWVEFRVKLLGGLAQTTGRFHASSHGLPYLNPTKVIRAGQSALVNTQSMFEGEREAPTCATKNNWRLFRE